MREFNFGAPVCCGDYDIIVVGGGVAGVSAALSAAREYKKVLLLEKTVCLGGLATTGLINWYEPLCDSKGTKMIGGISEELLHASIKYGGDTLAEEWRNGGDAHDTDKRYTTFFSPTAFSLAMLELLLDAGVTVRYDTLMTYPQMDGNICRGLLCETKTGCEYYTAKTVIDATGDADVIARAGCPTATGKNYMSYIGHIYEFDTDKEMHMTTLRKWKFIGAGMTGKGQPEDMPLLEGVTSDDVNRHMQRGQMMMLDAVKGMDRNKFELTSLPMMAQFRTTRHIIGDYLMSDGDLFAVHEDSVGIYADFRKSNKGNRYEIPYRALYNSAFPNLLAAGRIISAEKEAWMTSRVVPVACLTGEIAGLAAAAAVENGCGVHAVDVSALQKRLRDRGLKNHF